MRDIAFRLDETIGAKHELRMNNSKKLSDSAEFCAILCDWFTFGLYDMEGVDGVQTLIKIFRSKEIRLKESASKLENIICMGANNTSLDAIVRSIREIFKKEDHIANTLEGAINSPALNSDENEIPLSLHDSYALIKTNFHYLKRNPFFTIG